MKNLTIRLEEDLIEKLKELAKKDERNLSSFLRKAIKEQIIERR